MARSDLIVNLVKASARGDKSLAERTVEAIIAEERAKQHHVYADKLDQALQSGRNGQIFSSYSYNMVHEAPIKAKDYLYEINPSIRLDDLIIEKDTRSICDEFIEEQRRSDVLRSHSIEPRNRLLLAGSPGNGKTSLAEAVAEALGVPFFVVRYEAIIGSYLGETSERLRNVFDYARTTPCVLFFDEFDAVGKERGDIHETGEIKRVVSSLLMQVDKLPSYTVIIAATNHPELLDRAVWRRFQIRIELPSPGVNEIAEYISRYYSTIGGDPGLKSIDIARKLGKTSFSEVEEFCRDIQRRVILSYGNVKMKELVARQLKNWEKRYSLGKTGPIDKNNGRQTASKTSKSNTRGKG